MKNFALIICGTMIVLDSIQMMLPTSHSPEQLPLLTIAILLFGILERQK